MGAAGMSRKMEDWEQEKGCVQDLKENRYNLITSLKTSAED